MKIFKQATLLLVLIPCLSFGNSLDTISSQEVPKCSSINLKLGLKFGNEIGPTAKLEYENSNWGKIILHTEIADYKLRMLIIDIGLGYGYPVLRSKGNALYFNSHVTFSELGLLSTEYAGPSALFELEYRKTWSRVSLFISPYYRQQLLYDAQEYTYNRNLKHYLLDYTMGINVGISFNFPIKKRSAK